MRPCPAGCCLTATDLAVSANGARERAAWPAHVSRSRHHTAAVVQHFQASEDKGLLLTTPTRLSRRGWSPPHKCGRCGEATRGSKPSSSAVECTRRPPCNRRPWPAPAAASAAGASVTTHRDAAAHGTQPCRQQQATQHAVLAQSVSKPSSCLAAEARCNRCPQVCKQSGRGAASNMTHLRRPQ